MLQLAHKLAGAIDAGVGRHVRRPAVQLCPGSLGPPALEGARPAREQLSPRSARCAHGRVVDFYNLRRYHESLSNLTVADICFSRGQTILTREGKHDAAALLNPSRTFNAMDQTLS